MSIVEKIKPQVKNGQGYFSRICRGCTKRKPMSEFRQYQRSGEQRFSRYCLECEQWYMDHNIEMPSNNGEAEIKDSFTWGNNQEFIIL